MFFYMLQMHSNVVSAVINDINSDLITCYKVVRDNPEELVNSLQEIQNEYYSLPSDEVRKEFYLCMRAEFNTKKFADSDSLLVGVNLYMPRCENICCMPVRQQY